MRSSAQPKQSNQLCLPRLACATASRFREHEITGERNRGRNGRRERDGGVCEREGEFAAGQGACCHMERNPLSPWRHWVYDGFDTKRKRAWLHLLSVCPYHPPPGYCNRPLWTSFPQFLRLPKLGLPASLAVLLCRSYLMQVCSLILKLRTPKFHLILCCGLPACRIRSQVIIHCS